MTLNYYYQMKKLLIYGTDRSGTGLLLNLLNNSHLIHTEGELLSHSLNIDDPVQKIKEAELKSEAHVFGFKLLTYQLFMRFEDPVKFIKYLLSDDYKILYLRRRNIVRIAISNINARQKGKFHYFKKDAHDINRYSKIKIDINDLFKWIKVAEQNHERENEILKDIPVLSLFYEDDLSEEQFHQRTVEKVCNYIDIPIYTVSSRIVKNIPVELPDYIENFNELKEALRNTKYYEHLL